MIASQRIRVALVDDHSMVREALAMVLNAETDIEVVAQGGSCEETEAILDANEIDVLVLDYNLPDGSALDVLARLEEQGRELRVLVLTIHDSVHYALRTLKAGACGFLIKSSAVEELVSAIRCVWDGDTYVTPKYRGRVLSQTRKPRSHRTGLGSLSDREFLILRELAAGKSLKETAFTHNIGISTVSTYRSRIMKKLRLDTTSELIRFALENGI